MVESQLIETTLEALVPKGNSLFEAARYALFSGGKRLRPLLTLATAKAYNIPLEHAARPACALELIHTYSLIHDDLPCMDDDDMRRGKPTLHKVYPEGHAVLTGDFLLTYAFEVLAESPFLSAEQRLALIQTLSEAAGSQGMIGGQVIDLDSEGKRISWETLQAMHEGKTSALIAAALLFGGIIANAPKEDLKLLKSAGMNLGFAFQIVDDILDDGEEAEKVTAVTLLGKERAQSLADELLAEAKAQIGALSHPAPLLSSLSDKLVKRSH